MFELLVAEMDRLKTRKFHLVDGPASPGLRNAVETCDYPLPPSYREFVLRFGNAKLYRRYNYWLIEVYAGPRQLETDKGENLIQFGRTHSSLAYFKEEFLDDGAESPVFEWRHGQGVRRTADSFVDWFNGRCVWARKQFTKKEWVAIEHGPPPFSPEECAIVDARSRYRWRVIGIAPNDDIQFEIYNGSSMTLPYLSVGVKGRLRPPNTGPMTGSTFLPVDSILPGETRIVQCNCYKKLIVPVDTEILALPDPGPEDRSQYWEFKALP